MKVKMLKDHKASLDHINVREFVAGGVYEIPDRLAHSFIRNERAEAHEEPVKEETTAKPGDDVEEVMADVRPKRKRTKRARKR